MSLSRQLALPKACPLLKHMPALPKHATEDEQIEHRAFVDAVQILWNYPKERERTVTKLTNKLTGHQESDIEHQFQVAPDTIGDLDYDWLVQWAKKTFKLSDTVLARMKVYDSQALPNVFRLKHNLAKGLKCHPALQSKLVLHRAVAIRSDETANKYLSDLTSGGARPTVNPDTGAVAWGSIGLFGMVFDANQKCTKFVYKPTAYAVDVSAEYEITEAWDIVYNWSHTRAVVKKNAVQSYPILKFFKHHKGNSKNPHSDMPLGGSNTLWDDIVKRSVQQVDEQKQSATVGATEGPSPEFKKEIREQNKAATKRSMDKLQEAAAKRAAKRACKGSAAKVAAPAAAQP